jgi:hypothetical protein
MLVLVLLQLGLAAVLMDHLLLQHRVAAATAPLLLVGLRAGLQS